MFHNNPVRIANYESKLIWPDVEDRHSDILLSIGTGQNEVETGSSVDSGLTTAKRERGGKSPTKTDPVMARQRSMPALRAFPEVQSWLNILFKRVDNILDSESIWRSFRKDIIGASSSIVAERYVRINPKTRLRTPKMDDKSQAQRLHDEIKSSMESLSMRAKITNIAYRLVASCFWFERTGPTKTSDGRHVIKGMQIS